MNPDKPSFLKPLYQFFQSLPLLALALLAAPFLAPSIVEMIVTPFLPLVKPSVSGQDPRGQSLHEQLAKSRQEVAQLRSLLKNVVPIEKDNSRDNGILARNLGQSPRLFQHGLILDKGHADGISQDAVVVHTGSLIGLVDQVRKSWCHVRLVSDPSFNISVEIVGHNDREIPAEGWIRGLCGGHFSENLQNSTLEIRHVPEARFKDCQAGDYVVTSGIDFKAPAGLLLGRVNESTQEKTQKLFLKILVNCERDARHLPLFTVIPPPANPFKETSTDP